MHFHQKPNTIVTEVQLNVQDFSKMKDFYTTILDLKIINETPSTIAFTADGQQVLLTLVATPDFSPRPKRSAGMYHFALLLPERSDLANFTAHLHQAGYPFAAADHSVSEALYLTDPEGNEIEIYIDRLPEEWTWQDELVEMTIDPLNFNALAQQQTAAGWKGIPTKTIMGHLHLYVSDLEQTKDFYTKGLGFDIVSRYAHQALFLATGQYHHHIAINTWMGVGAPKAQPNQLGMSFYTLQYPDITALNQAIEHLEALSHSVQKNETGATVTDPSGIRVQMVSA